MCSGPLIPSERGGLPSVQWALYHPSWERRFTWCAVGPSSLLREDAYLVFSGPLIPPERGVVPSVQWALPPSWERRLIPSVQWALNPSWEKRFTQCAVSPSSLLREEVYPVCCGTLLPPERGCLPNVQWAPHPWLCLKDKIYPITQCAVGPWSLTGPERWGLPSAQPAPHPSQGWGLAGVQWASHSS